MFIFRYLYPFIFFIVSLFVWRTLLHCFVVFLFVNYFCIAISIFSNFGTEHPLGANLLFGVRCTKKSLTRLNDLRSRPI